MAVGSIQPRWWVAMVTMIVTGQDADEGEQESCRGRGGMNDLLGRTGVPSWDGMVLDDLYRSYSTYRTYSMIVMSRLMPRKGPEYVRYQYCTVRYSNRKITSIENAVDGR
jgi:hypothetical protein